MIRILIQRTSSSEDGVVRVAGLRRNRSALIKFGLGALALVGIGAGVTAAAWTDDAYFSANATSASVKLQGALANCDVAANACSWKDADTSDSTTAVPLPPGFLQGLVPNPDDVTATPKTATIWLKNSGSAPLKVAVNCVKVGGLFAAPAPLVPSLDSGLASTTCSGSANSTLTLAAGVVQQVTVTVTIPAAWPATYAGQSGANASSLTLRFTGTAG